MYIRTDFHIYEIKSEEIIQGEKYYNIEIRGGLNKLKAEFGKQSENLDELCDEFVIHRKEHNYNFVWNEDRNIGLNYFCFLPEKYDVYGAVWVDGKGLIYVAKMNDEGKLVLI